MGNARFSDRWIEDGFYLKLKNDNSVVRTATEKDCLENAFLDFSQQSVYFLQTI